MLSQIGMTVTLCLRYVVLGSHGPIDYFIQVLVTPQ